MKILTLLIECSDDHAPEVFRELSEELKPEGFISADEETLTIRVRSCRE